MDNPSTEEFLKTVKQLQEEIKKLKESSRSNREFEDYIKRGMFYANVPDNPFAHQFQQIHRPPKKIEHADDIVSASEQLANIKDNRTMLLFQRDANLLTCMYDMAERSGGVKSLFNMIYYGWTNSIKLTAALEGKERNLQAFLEPETTARGFSFLWRKKEKRQKKRPVDYLTPDHEGGIYE